MTEACEKLIAKARRYELDPREPYRAQEKSDTDIWYEVIHDHWLNILQPTLKKNGELFIEFWPVWFIADREHALQKGLISGDFHDFEYGTYGTGYVCLTNRNLYIVAIDALTKRFPLNKASLTGFLADILSKRINSTRPFKGDRIWTFAPSSIVGASLSSDRRGAERIKLATATETWEIFEHFFDQRFEIFEGIECLRAGQFADLRPKWHFTKQPPIISQAELDQRLRSRPRTTFMPSPVDPARAVEGAKMLDFHYLAEQVIQRGGAEVELDLAHAAASEQGNRLLQELRWAVANMRHLLDRCQSVDEALDTVHLRIDRSSGLAEQYRRSIGKLSRPYLRSLHQLPDRPHRALVRTIPIGKLHNPEGYGDDYLSVVWGPNGDTLLTAGNDGVVRIWSLVTGEVVDQLVAFEGREKDSHHSHWISRLVLSPDGAMLLTVSLGQGIKAWNTADWSLRFLIEEDWHIQYCGFDARGACFAYSKTGSGKVLVLDARTGQPVAHRVNFENIRHQDDAGLVSFRLAPSGDWVLVEIEEKGSGPRLRLTGVGMSSGEEYFAFREFDVHHLEISQRGDRIYTWAGPFNHLNVWNTMSGDWESEISRPEHGPWKLSPSGRDLVYVFDGTIVIYDTQSRTEKQRLVDHIGSIWDCALSLDERYLLSCHERHENVVRIWDLTRTDQATDLPRYFLKGGKADNSPHSRSCKACVVNPADDTLIVVNLHNTWNDDASVLSSKSGGNSERYFEPRPIGQVLFGMANARLSQIHHFSIRLCAVSPNGEQVFLLGRTEWGIFDTKRLNVIKSAELGFDGQSINTCALNPDHQLVAFGRSNNLSICNVDTGQTETISARSPVQACVFDSEGQWLVWASGGSAWSSDLYEFKMRDLKTGSTRSFDVPEVVESKQSSYMWPAFTVWGFIRDCCITPDGRQVIAAHSNGTISAWDIASLKLVNSWQAHHTGWPPQIACAAMPDNQTVITVAHDGAVKVWDIRNGKCLASAYTDDELADCDVFPDGKRVVAVGKAGVHWLEIVR